MIQLRMTRKWRTVRPVVVIDITHLWMRLLCLHAYWEEVDMGETVSGFTEVLLILATQQEGAPHMADTITLMPGG